jgi:hypothetical protein
VTRKVWLWQRTKSLGSIRKRYICPIIEGVHTAWASWKICLTDKFGRALDYSKPKVAGPTPVKQTF